MKILCAYSSVEFECSHFPAALFSREMGHPIFYLPQKKLLAYIGKWASGELTPTDNYLLFLAVLKSTDLVDFRVPAIRTPSTPAIIATNLEDLFKITAKMNTITNPHVAFPHVAITPETKTLENIRHWIYNWNEAYADFVSGKEKDYDDRLQSRRITLREGALERLIKNPHKPVSAYSTAIAEWAAIAGSFPAFQTIDRISGVQTSCDEYWKHIIQKCAHEDGLFSINKEDLDELIEHCETEIPIGTIFSNALFKMLRHAKEKHKNFLGLGDIDIVKTTYQILNSTDSVEDANIRAMMQSAPMEEPKRENYGTKFEYMKAKYRYDMSRKYNKESE